MKKLMKFESFLDVKTVYGDNMYEWVDISMEKGDNDTFSYTTEKGTVIYGEDMADGNGYIVGFVTCDYFLEGCEETHKSRHKTLEESRKQAGKLIKDLIK